jgi:Asp-tRNA(Asn)/Glu-tRNA(Gln) amidotransferase B subunit
MFNKLYYDDLLKEEEIKSNIENFELERYTNSYIKVVVKNKENPYLFDLYVDSLYKINPIDLVIIEEISEVLNEELNDIDETEDTMTILAKFVDNIKTKDLESNKLKGILSSLYNEALSLDTI